MNMDELKTRIQRYRKEYLDTPEGREHLKTAEDEAKEVQAVYAELSKKRQAGEDITEETLMRLLPYSNTKGNKERGGRISTWPCITKDVKSWFEGANWKQPDEWPAAAEWLPDISEAGKSQDWAGWRSLASQPSQKGFACGFITPIVHCLNSTLPVINSKVVKTYKAVAKELGLGTKISSALEEYPENQKLLADLVTQLKDLGIDGLREWDIYCHWNVAKKLGGGVVVPPTPQPPVAPPVPAPPSSVIKQLHATQHDTKSRWWTWSGRGWLVFGLVGVMQPTLQSVASHGDGFAGLAAGTERGLSHSVASRDRSHVTPSGAAGRPSFQIVQETRSLPPVLGC
jgi:hypothetical protein